MHPRARKNKSKASLFFSESTPDIRFISDAVNGLKAFAKRTLSSMCSQFRRLPTTATATGKDSLLVEQFFPRINLDSQNAHFLADRNPSQCF